MFTSLLRLVAHWSRFLMVRIVFFAFLAVFAVVASLLFGNLIPDEISGYIGQDAMDTIVNTLASSMLAVTTFSLSIMAAAYQSAAGALTPRSRLVLRQDRETQSVLAAFVGAFVFSLVTIILRATPLIGEKERFLLFCATVIVVLIVLFAIIRWIKRLETLGANDDTLASLQQRACAAMETYSKSPACGAHIWTVEARKGFEGKPSLKARRSGYIQQILEDVLQEVASENDALIYVAVSTGDYVVEGQPLLYCEGMDEQSSLKLYAGFYIAQSRSYEQDPLLGVQVMSEVASRALSPAINDPQTAVDVINRLSAVFITAKPDTGPIELRCDRVWIVPQSVQHMFERSYDVIARDGREFPEIRMTLRESLERVAKFGTGDTAKMAKTTSERLELSFKN